MKKLLDVIKREQLLVEKHSFFLNLKQFKAKDVMISMASDLSLWVLVFQDILDLIEDTVQDPEMKKLARAHKIEDKGHHLWFFEDIEFFDLKKEDIVFKAFSTNNYYSRKVVYKIISEALNLKNDKLKLIYLMALESPGHIFFRNMSFYFRNLKIEDKLKYFSRNHLELEEDHSIFEKDQENIWNQYSLSKEEFQLGEKMVIEVHQLFHQLFSILQNQIQRSSSFINEEDLCCSEQTVPLNP